MKELKECASTCKAGECFSFEVINPDKHTNYYSGSSLTCKDTSYVYRGYKTYVDLAQQLFCRMLTPKVVDECCVEIRFEKLDITSSFHSDEVKEVSEKYGVKSDFFTIHKNEESTFLHTYLQALRAIKIEKRERILNLGINSGDEFALIKEHLCESLFSKILCVGIDYSSSAIRYANSRFNEDNNISCIEHDINALETLNLQKSDVIISIGTLQSPEINFKTLFMSLVQNYLSDDGAMILGFPNSRWMGGELIYGAKAPNYAYSEMSLVIKDIYWCKKYLQQHKFRVTLTGKDYIFLTATKLGSL